MSTVKRSLQFLADRGAGANGSAARAAALIFQRTNDAEARRLCLDALYKINSKTAKNALLRLYRQEQPQSEWRPAIAERLRKAVAEDSRMKPPRPGQFSIRWASRDTVFCGTFLCAKGFNPSPWIPAAHCSLTLPASGLALCLSRYGTSQDRQKRVVVIKVDGLPYEMVERFAREHDPLTGKSLLPWFDNVFFKNGTRLTNFYVRGMSLSAPSWSTLDTGQHLQIKGNVEFDRDILHTYDYLNFIPFYFKQATGARCRYAGD